MSGENCEVLSRVMFDGGHWDLAEHLQYLLGDDPGTVKHDWILNGEVGHLGLWHESYRNVGVQEKLTPKWDRLTAGMIVAHPKDAHIFIHRLTVVLDGKSFGKDRRYCPARTAIFNGVIRGMVEIARFGHVFVEEYVYLPKFFATYLSFGIGLDPAENPEEQKNLLYRFTDLTKMPVDLRTERRKTLKEMNSAFLKSHGVDGRSVLCGDDSIKFVEQFSRRYFAQIESPQKKLALLQYHSWS